MATATSRKRHRTSQDSSAFHFAARARKRRVQESPIETDHEDDPISTSTRHSWRRVVQSIDVFEDQEYTSSTSSPGISPSSKGSGSVIQDTLSLTKVNSHFKISKAVADENTPPIFKTPQTKRFQDALSIAPPVTPKHRVSVIGKPRTPKTPRNATIPHTSTVYSQARQLFACSANPGRLVGREAERREIASFVQERIDSKSGGCLYVSGPPGTGKSALVSEFCEELSPDASLKIVHINCVSMKGANDLRDKLLEYLFEKSELHGQNLTQLLKSKIIPKRKSTNVSFLVTLDEIDHLLFTDVEMLYLLFEWSLHPNSRLILIGIANALDLTDRFLPRLRSRNLKPHLIPFLPYSAPQIASIIIARLQSLATCEPDNGNQAPLLHPAAIQLCSKKVASQTGDLRKAFDIVYRTLDVIESETRQKHQQKIELEALVSSPSKSALVESVNFSSPASMLNPTSYMTSPAYMESLTPETAPRATIAHVARVTSAAFGNGTVQRLSNLNLQQKAALCSLVAMEKKCSQTTRKAPATPSKTKSLSPTIKQLFDSYCSLCKRDNVLHPLTSTEFRDVVTSLETIGLVTEVDGKNGSFKPKMVTPSKRGRSAAAVGVEDKKMASCISEKELLDSIEGAGGDILKTLLSQNERYSLN